MHMTLFEDFCQRYVERFEKVPRRQIGVEKEILVTDPEGNMAKVVERVWPKLEAQNLPMVYDPVYKDQVTGFKVDDAEITTDAGWGTFEVILEPMDTVADAERVMKDVLRRLLPMCTEEGYKVLGLGYQPLAAEDPKYWNRKQRYEILDSVLGQAVRPSLLGAADQAHVDISVDEFVPVTNALSSVAGFLMLLFSNSPVRNGEVSVPQVYREMFWEGLGKERTAIPERPWESVEDYLSAMWKIPCIMAKDKNGVYYDAGCSFEEHVEGMDLDGIFDAFCLHEGCIWFCARPRVFGTIEVRPICTQPWDDMLSGAAVITGLVENWQELEAFLKDFSWEERRQLRHDAAYEGFRLKIKGRDSAEFVRDVLDIAKRGMDVRGEDYDWSGLYGRVERQEAPSDHAIALFEEGGVPHMVEKTSLRESDLLG